MGPSFEANSLLSLIYLQHLSHKRFVFTLLIWFIFEKLEGFLDLTRQTDVYWLFLRVLRTISDEEPSFLVIIERKVLDMTLLLLFSVAKLLESLLFRFMAFSSFSLYCSRVLITEFSYKTFLDLDFVFPKDILELIVCSLVWSPLISLISSVFYLRRSLLIWSIFLTF